jgi:hypothetical protein
MASWRDEIQTGVDGNWNMIFIAFNVQFLCVGMFVDVIFGGKRWFQLLNRSVKFEPSEAGRQLVAIGVDSR